MKRDPNADVAGVLAELADDEMPQDVLDSAVLELTDEEYMEQVEHVPGNNGHEAPAWAYQSTPDVSARVGGVEAYRRSFAEQGKPTSWTRSDLRGVLDPQAGTVNYLLRPLVPRGALVVIAATWKAGKTLLIYRVLLDAVLGRRVLDGLDAPDEPVRVSVWQCEMPDHEDDRRLRRLAIGSDISVETIPELAAAGRLAWYSRPGLDLTDPAQVARWHAEIRQTDSGLVLVDSALAVFAGEDLNVNTTVRRLFSNAFGPLTSEGRSVLLLHHRRKAVQNGKPDDDRSSLLGAQAIGASADRVYGLERITEANGSAGAFSLRLSLTGSWAPGDSTDWIVRVQDDGAGTSVRVVPEGEQIRQGGVTAGQKVGIKLARLVTLRQSITRTDAIAEIRADLEISERSVETGMRFAKDRGWITTTMEGKVANLTPGPASDWTTE